MNTYNYSKLICDLITCVKEYSDDEFFPRAVELILSQYPNLPKEVEYNIRDHFTALYPQCNLSMGL